MAQLPAANDKFWVKAKTKANLFFFLNIFFVFICLANSLILSRASFKLNNSIVEKLQLILCWKLYWSILYIKYHHKRLLNPLIQNDLDNVGLDSHYARTLKRS